MPEAERTPLHQMLDERRAELNTLWARMDTDRDLYTLKAYTMRDKDDRAVPQVENITLNDPLTYADAVIASLAGAHEQTVVEGDSLATMPDGKASVVEAFLRGLFEDNDDRLRELGLPAGLHAIESGFAAIRGHLAARVLLWQDGDGRLVPEVMPCDPRFVTWRPGRHGLRWAGYTISKSRDEVEEEYGIQIAAPYTDITDLWTADRNYILDSNVVLREQEHRLGYVPFVVQPVPGGLFLADADWTEHTGESIFSANRGLFPEMNQVATVLHTLNLMSFRAGVQYKNERGVSGKVPAAPPFGSGFVVAVEKDGGFFPMPATDVKNASRLLLNILESRLQRGSMADVDYGNLTFPLSAVAIAKLSATKDRIFLPRFQALALFRRAVSRMLIKQYLAGQYSYQAGKPGNRRPVQRADLEGDYKISYRYASVSPEQVIANYSVATVAERYLDQRRVLADIIQVDDPEDVQQRKLADAANLTLPQLQLYRMARAKLAIGEEVEAKIIAAHLGMTLEQIRSGQVAPGTPAKAAQEKSIPAELLPLLGKGGPRMRAKSMPGGDDEMDMGQLE